MAEIIGFVPLKKDYAVFVIITGMEGGIPLVIEKGNFLEKKWKLPGGRPIAGDKGDEEVTAMREVNDEIGVIINCPEEEVLRIEKSRHDFVVLKAEYFSGKPEAKAEIERVSVFPLDQIKQMISEESIGGYILPDHANALRRYIGNIQFFKPVQG